MERLSLVRSAGYALIDQEVEIGLRSIAVPLLSARGDVVAALNIGVAALQDGPEVVKDHYLHALLKVQSGLRRILP